MLGHFELVGMDYLDKIVPLQQVIATKDPNKIRSKVESLLPKGPCTVYLWLNQSDKEKPVLEAVGVIDTSEVGVAVDIRKRQAQELKDYLLLDVVYPVLKGKHMLWTQLKYSISLQALG